MKQLALILSLLGIACVQAQLNNNGATVTCIGRTISHEGGLSDYLLWQSGDEDALFGKSYAIYRKAGSFDSPNPYQLLGRQETQTAPAVVFSLLKQGSAFDYDGHLLPGRLATLAAETLSQEAPANLPSEVTLELAGQLSEIMGVAVESPEVAQTLQMLGRTHPGVMLALGQGFHIRTEAGNTWTYEVREVDFQGNDLRVIGRVTLEANNPVALSQPGPPVSVTRRVFESQHVEVSPADHLNGRFRWQNRVATVAEVPQIFGYNLYRVKEQVAIGLNWTDGNNPPDTADLEALANSSLGQVDPDCARANGLPILPNKTLGPETYDLQAAGDEAGELVDRNSYFFVDSIKSRSPIGERRPFNDGDTYYYFAAARDIAGYPGPASAGTRFVFCSRLAPPAPVILGVDNTYQAPASILALQNLEGEQRFQVRIRPLENDEGYTYYIYRWEYSAEATERGSDPTINLVGDTTNPNGDEVITWVDNSPGAPVIQGGDQSWEGKVVWYTVRVEDSSACAPKNLSLHSPPMSGVLRDFVDPGSPTGSFDICTYEPTASFEGETSKTLAEVGVGPDFVGFAIRINRVSNEIGSYRCVVTEGAPEEEVLVQEGDFGDEDSVLIVMPTAAASSSASVWGYNRVGRESNEAKGTRTKVSLPGSIDCLDFELDTVKTAVPPNDPDIPHEVVDNDGTINNIPGTLVLPEGSFEYRVYRRIGDDGPLELIQSGSGPDLPMNVNWVDQAPPTGNVVVCFFGQVFDQNGNAGPLMDLGCTPLVNSNMPTPLLTPVKALAAADGFARVRLDWFCDPVGVERFVVWVATPDAPEAPLDELSGVGLSPAIASNHDLNLEGEFAGLRFTGFQTQTLSSAFGPGPEFEATFTIPSTGELFFVVQAVGPGAVDRRPKGAPSNVVSERWVQPDPTSDGLIPWPQRGLAQSADFPQEVTSFGGAEGPFYAFKAPDDWEVPAAILVGAYQDPPVPGTGKLKYEADFPSYRTPETWFFRVPNGGREEGQPSKALLPFMIYRYQLESARFPDAQPNLVQVSPLLDRISYKTVFKPDIGSNVHEVRDPFFRFESLADAPPVPFSGSIGKSAQPNLDDPAAPTEPVPDWLLNDDGLIFWIDQQPVVSGAKYQYLMVRFTPRGEVERIIPLNAVQQ